MLKYSQTLKYMDKESVIDCLYNPYKLHYKLPVNITEKELQQNKSSLAQIQSNILKIYLLLDHPPQEKRVSLFIGTKQVLLGNTGFGYKICYEQTIDKL